MFSTTHTNHFFDLGSSLVGGGGGDDSRYEDFVLDDDRTQVFDTTRVQLALPTQYKTADIHHQMARHLAFYWLLIGRGSDQSRLTLYGENT